MLKIKSIIISLALSVYLCHCSPTIRDQIAEQRSDDLNYLLNENVFPKHYTIKISPQFNNLTFKGNVQIVIDVKIPTNSITLHQKNLNITKEKIYLTTTNDTVINIKDAGNRGTILQEFYTITFHEILKKDKYYLNIPEFYGVINKLNRGFYYADYTDEQGILHKFATTHFESTSARYAFPCFDEPSFRAQFKIYIIRPSDYSSISNTKLLKSRALNDSLFEDEFDTTVSMPTYLVAYIVSKMNFSINQGTDFHRIFARPEAIRDKYEQYSLQMAPKVLQTLETYFNITYSLNKMDQVAIPDKYFTAGAMENWGLVTYKEIGLLLTPRTTTKKHKYIDTVIAHEFTHQWFGNLVTIKNWRYLWMKEGFARFFENKIINMIKPEWKIMEQFIVMEKHLVLEIDSFVSTRDMNQDAGSPSEISALYDKIAYTKGACIIHMIETVMTPNIFKNGLTNYLRDRAFQSAIPSDLYRNLQKAMDKTSKKLPEKLSIHEIMTTWTTQKGYPLVTVQRNYSKSQDIVQLTQGHFIFTGDLKPIGKKTARWDIPINYATKSNPNFNDTQFSDWLVRPNADITIKNLNRDAWLILNKQEAFYYRVNYDERNWKLITKALLANHNDIHVLNRAQIIDDSFALANVGILSYSVPFDICEYLNKDDDYTTQYVFLRQLHDIEKVLRGTAAERHFQSYVIQVFKRSYERLGAEPRASDTLNDKLHRVAVVNWMCYFNYSDCRESAGKIFAKRAIRKLPVDLEEVIMCNAIRKGTQKDWNNLFTSYYSAKEDDLKVNIFKSLACSLDDSILQGFLNFSLKSSNNYTLLEVVTLISSKGLIGSQNSMNYLTEHYDSLQAIFGDTNMLVFVRTVTAYFTSKAQADKFIKQLEKTKTATKVLQGADKDIRSVASKNEKKMKQFSKYFGTWFKQRPNKNVSNTFSNFPISLIFILPLFYFAF